jgi:hypothetical protein
MSVLNQRLREALVSQRKSAAWQSEQKTLQGATVDRDVSPRENPFLLMTLIILPHIRLYRLYRL